MALNEEGGQFWQIQLVPLPDLVFGWNSSKIAMEHRLNVGISSIRQWYLLSTRWDKSGSHIRGSRDPYALLTARSLPPLPSFSLVKLLWSQVITPMYCICSATLCTSTTSTWNMIKRKGGEGRYVKNMARLVMYCW